jgi:hypothetical protein
MFRFTDQVRGGEVVRDVKQRFPETSAVFEKHGVRASCYDCSIDQAARKVGAVVGDLLVEVNEVILQTRGAAQSESQ